MLQKIFCQVRLNIIFQGTGNFDTIYIFIGKFHTRGFWTHDLNLHLTTMGRCHWAGAH